MLSISYSQITSHLWVGSYPQAPEDVIHMKSVGVTAVLNLQTDEDLDARAVNWDLFWKFYVRNGLHVVRFPIRDFDPDALDSHLDGAVAALHDLMNAGRAVYLHCTAGMNRSPTVAIAWLHRHQGMSIDEATEHVKSRRSCFPYPEVLERWAAIRR